MESELGVTAVAAALGTKRSAVRKAIVRGTLRARKETTADGGYRWLVPVEEVDRYAREHRTERRS